MNTYNTTWSRFKFELKILEPTTERPLASTVHRKILIRLKTYGGTYAYNISFILFYEIQQSTCKESWGYHIETELSFGIFPIQPFYILTITISCTVDEKREIWIICVYLFNGIFH